MENPEESGSVIITCSLSSMSCEKRITEIADISLQITLTQLSCSTESHRYVSHSCQKCER